MTYATLERVLRDSYCRTYPSGLVVNRFSSRAWEQLMSRMRPTHAACAQRRRTV